MRTPPQLDAVGEKDLQKGQVTNLLRRACRPACPQSWLEGGTKKRQT